MSITSNSIIQNMAVNQALYYIIDWRVLAGDRKDSSILAGRKWKNQAHRLKSAQASVAHDAYVIAPGWRHALPYRNCRTAAKCRGLRDEIVSHRALIEQACACNKTTSAVAARNVARGGGHAAEYIIGALMKKCLSRAPRMLGIVVSILRAITSASRQ
jgi:hypothetical protein